MPETENLNKLVPVPKMEGFRQKGFTKALLFLLLVLILIGLFLTSALLDQEVMFSDENLELAIRDILGYSGKPIHQSQLSNIRSLDLSNKGIADLTGIEHFRNLEELNLSYNQINNLNKLKSLYKLRILNLENNQISDLEAAEVSKLKFLQELNLRGNSSSNFNVLEELPNLISLDISANQIESIDFIADLSNLESLNLQENNISDLTPLINLQKLTYLNLRVNNISDLTPLINLEQLTYLNLHSNKAVESIGPIKNLVKLETLILRDVPIGNEISYLENLSNLSYLNLRNCSLTNIHVLAQLMQQGALQDDPLVGKFAYLDILENDFSQDPNELKSFVPYWENIHITHPDIINFMTLEPPEFSIPSGFYKIPLKLELSTKLKNVKIYYTLDGSNPTINSMLYTEPIQLDSLFSATTNLPKANVIRAKIINNSGNEVSPVVAHTYFIGDYDFQSSGLPVVSLVMDPKYLFDPEVGFYRTINDLERGLKWEHPAQIEFFEAEGDLGFSAVINTRINGVASRKFPQKSFRIIADVDYQPENTINYALFPDNYDQIENQLITEYDTLILRNSGTEKYRTLLRDAMIQSLFQHTSLDMQSYRPSILYLNGTYWGIYNIRERIDEAYINHHYQIPEDSVIILNLVVNSGLSSNSVVPENYKDFIQYIQTNDVNDPNVYAHINEIMDIDNFINYQVIEIYAANGDWPRNNVRFWKVDTDKSQPENAPGLDGRWRWILYDLDYGFLDYRQNSLSNAIIEDESTILFKPLLENETFKLQLINRFADHLNTSFQPARVISEINKMADAIEPEIPIYVMRWPTMLGSTENWQNAIDEMKIFAEKRPAILQEMLIDFFDLAGTANIFITSSTVQGYVKVNSIDIIESTPGINNPENWQGCYFIGIPITLSAVEAEGYKFSHWEVDGIFFSDSKSIIIVPENDLHLSPIFEIIPTN